MTKVDFKKFNASIDDLRATIDEYLKKKVDGEELYKKAVAKADKNIQAEDEFRDDLYSYLKDKGYKVLKEEQVDPDPESGKEYRLLDLLVKGEEDECVPIQLKFNEESQDEIEEDFDIIDHCIEYYDDIKKGYVILLTNAKDSNFESKLRNTAHLPYRFAVWLRM